MNIPGRPARSARWKPGHALRLLENGEEFFPAVFEAVGAARREVLIETFILFEDKVGLALRDALVAAARRGVQVDLTVDGFGSSELTPPYIASLCDAGVRLHVFDPQPRLFGFRLNVFRRMHRKLVVIDGERAFVGGINYSADHLADFGPEAKQDYAVEVIGPVVADIRRFVSDALDKPAPGRHWLRRRADARTVPDPTQAEAGPAQAMFVTRDNAEHRTAIERHYRVAIRSARHEVVIANAYFFPGYRLLRELRRAARRGVRVRLILQGEPDMAIVKTAAEMLYEHLLRANVKVYEYCKRPLHGKVALVDDEWCTVGSSNLDPLSLALNLEANLVVRDRAFNACLRERLESLMEHGCKEISVEPNAGSRVWRGVRSFFVFHFLRRFPAWAGWLPAHAPRLASTQPPAAPEASSGASGLPDPH